MSETVYVVNVSLRGDEVFYPIGAFTTKELAQSHLDQWLDARWGKGNWFKKDDGNAWYRNSASIKLDT